MKVSFWSPSHENCAVTSNLACISVLFSMLFSYKSVLMENHQQVNRLENVLKFTKTNYYVREEANYHYMHTGMNSILYHLSSKKGGHRYKRDKHKVAVAKLLEAASDEIIDSRLFYIPYGNRTNKEIFEYNMYEHIKMILDGTDIFADVTFIDTSNRNNLSSKIVLEEADLVVVNLLQDSVIIEDFFKNYSSILSKCVFLISYYNKNSNFNINDISQTHLIDKSNIAVIPFNDDYQEALKCGKLIGFFMNHFYCGRNDPNYYFVKEAKNAAMMIYKSIELFLEAD